MNIKVFVAKISTEAITFFKNIAAMSVLVSCVYEFIYLLELSLTLNLQI